MQIRFTDAMLKTIAQHVQEARASNTILDVYKSAELIRLENISDNMAREDIIEKLVLLAGSVFVPLEFNRHSIESERACYDTTVYSTNASFTDALQENESVH